MFERERNRQRGPRAGTRQELQTDRPGFMSSFIIPMKKLCAIPWLVPILIAVVGIGWGWSEMRYSQLQARLFSGIANGISYEVKPGASRSLWLPRSGPYDSRLGYSHMQQALPRLAAAGYGVEAQARQSTLFSTLTGFGLYPIYREKSQAGLKLLDRSGKPIYIARHPNRQYPDFDSIPPSIVSMLLFIENRDLLDDDRPSSNPAVEWDRLALAVVMQTARNIDAAASRLGGSTLATQIEKFRHSPGGRTRGAGDKLRQMMSASVRAYLDGQESLDARRRIALDYLNSVPLGAVPGYGEVIGLGDGLWAWYGRDFNEVNALLSGRSGDSADAGAAYKEVLSLIVAQRRPSELLGERPDRLEELTDSYLRILAREGVITPSLRDAALDASISPRRQPVSLQAGSFVERKAVNAARGSLASLLDIDNPYALDRYDLTVSTTLDHDAQKAVTAFLLKMADEDFLRRAGFKSEHLLDRGDPRQVRYSFTLFESSPMGSLVRVHADNVDKPFDLNVGVKLDLGSTAKLRTVMTYLEVLSDLHARYGHIPAEGLAVVPLHEDDVLSRWAVDYLRSAPDRSLEKMLEAAMQRKYSASTAETFFTGGGLHTFHNFNKEDNARTPTLQDALEQSINLPFVRLMRDIVHYYAYEVPGAPGQALRYGDAGARERFLDQFVEQESREFMQRFWSKYDAKSTDKLLPTLAASVKPIPSRLAVVFRTVEPEAGFDAFAAFMKRRLHGHAVTEQELAHLYAEYAPGKFGLADLGYLARVHPLELWLVSYLRTHSGATLHQAIEASAAERRASYKWLYESKSRKAQDIRIHIALEAAAFEPITESWRRLGYPFEHLVPSYATAIGVSADRPAALGELMGVILNGGVRQAQVRVTSLRFAADTPFETTLVRNPDDAERVTRPEVAAVARRALLGIVERGTARRLHDVFHDASGKALAVGGKTGTGDHRFDVVGRGGQVISSRVVNRSATFVFYIGDRFFGTVTAFVPGRQAADYDFTSALPVQMVKELEPALRPLLQGQPDTTQAYAASLQSAG
jgi:membrane peptidoglycan carboxypeptidase